MYGRFEQLLQMSGKSRYQVSKDTGVPQSSLSSWIHGVSVPSSTNLKKIADYFGVTMAYLMGDDTELEPLDPPQDQRRIPILGRIPCGVPVREITDIEGYIYYEPSRCTSAEYVALRVTGPSMEPEIRDGSVVVIRVSETCDPGDICAVSVDDEGATCKIVKPDPDGGVYLIPINPAFDPMHYTAQEIKDHRVRIIGTVEEVRYAPRKRQ